MAELNETATGGQEKKSRLGRDILFWILGFIVGAAIMGAIVAGTMCETLNKLDKYINNSSGQQVVQEQVVETEAAAE